MKLPTAPEPGAPKQGYPVVCGPTSVLYGPGDPAPHHHLRTLPGTGLAFDALFTGALQREQETFTRPSRPGLRQIWDCLRSVWLTIHPESEVAPIPLAPFQLRRMMRGRIIANGILDVFQAAGVLIGRELPVVLDNTVGQMDAVLPHPEGGLAMVELKAPAPRYHRSRTDPTQDRPSYGLQGLAYRRGVAQMLQHPDPVRLAQVLHRPFRPVTPELVAVLLNLYQQIRHWRVVLIDPVSLDAPQYDVHDRGRLAALFTQVWPQVRDLVQTPTEPPRSPREDWQCTGCPWSWHCYRQEFVAAQGWPADGSAVREFEAQLYAGSLDAFSTLYRFCKTGTVTPPRRSPTAAAVDRVLEVCTDTPTMMHEALHAVVGRLFGMDGGTFDQALAAEMVHRAQLYRPTFR